MLPHDSGTCLAQFVGIQGTVSMAALPAPDGRCDARCIAQNTNMDKAYGTKLDKNPALSAIGGPVISVLELAELATLLLDL